MKTTFTTITAPLATVYVSGDESRDVLVSLNGATWTDRDGEPGFGFVIFTEGTPLRDGDNSDEPAMFDTAPEAMAAMLRLTDWMGRLASYMDPEPDLATIFRTATRG